jgi:hypothetical protein
VPQDVASSGEVITDAHDVLTLRAVGDSEHKVKGAYNRDLKMVVLPLSNRNELEQNVRVPKVVRGEIVRYAPDVDTAVRIFFGEDIFVSTGNRDESLNFKSDAAKVSGG